MGYVNPGGYTHFRTDSTRLGETGAWRHALYPKSGETERFGGLPPPNEMRGCGPPDEGRNGPTIATIGHIWPAKISRTEKGAGTVRPAHETESRDWVVTMRGDDEIGR